MIHALKEWNIVIQALTGGETIVLLRKGGIRETTGQFNVPFRQVWLYPTFEHQKPEGLKPSYGKQVQGIQSGWHPESVSIQAWANITHVLPITQEQQVDVLYPFHVWTQEFARSRFQWKPKSPLYVMLLRAYRLANIITIPFDEAYRGCNSWIDLKFDSVDEMSRLTAAPVLSDNEYSAQIRTITSAVSDKKLG